MTASREHRERRLPRLHLVTHDDLLRRDDFSQRAAPLLEAGGAAVALHLRARHLSGRRLFELGERMRSVARATGARLFVNDRIDVALACDADGVQLGERSFRPATARDLLGPVRWIGASVHDKARAAEAAREGADFLIAGTLYRSASHPESAPAGTRWLAELATADRPVIGIGGVTPERVPEALRAGAYGVAVIRGIWEAPRPDAALHAYLQALDSERR